MRLHKSLETPCFREPNTRALISSADVTIALYFFIGLANTFALTHQDLYLQAVQKAIYVHMYIPLPSQSPRSISLLTPESHSTTTAQTQLPPSQKYPSQTPHPRATSTRGSRPAQSTSPATRRKRSDTRERWAAG